MRHEHILVSADTEISYRCATVAELFDVPYARRTEQSWDVAIPIDERDWRIGLIVGPSGCGKSVIARTLWPESYHASYEWGKTSILDSFAEQASARDIADALIAVAFDTPADWVKPYANLSTGQQMRANLARALCDPSPLVVFDEFTSVVDRRTAQIGSNALAHTVRQSENKRFIAVTCHDDVEAWLKPDWVYDPFSDLFAWGAREDSISRARAYVRYKGDTLLTLTI